MSAIGYTLFISLPICIKAIDELIPEDALKVCLLAMAGIPITGYGVGYAVKKIGMRGIEKLKDDGWKVWILNPSQLIQKTVSEPLYFEDAISKDEAYEKIKEYILKTEQDEKVRKYLKEVL